MYEIFARLLKEKGLTTYRVAKDTGIANTTLSAWKRGVSQLKADKLKIIADYLGVSVAYIMGISDIPNEELTIEEAEKQLEEARISAENNRKLAEQYQKEADEIQKRLLELNRMLGIMERLDSLTPEQRNAIEILINQFNNK